MDTLGLLLAVVVTAANEQDRDGAMSLLVILRHQCSRMRLIWADQAYSGDLVTWLWGLRPWRKVRLRDCQAAGGDQGLPAPAETVDRRADLRMVRPLPAFI